MDIYWEHFEWKGDVNDKWKTKDKRVFDYIVEYFVNTKIMLPDATLLRKNHGLPSGSLFTSIVGSLINRLVNEVLFRSMGIPIQKSAYLGDDSLIFVRRHHIRSKFDLSTFIKRAKDWFNLTLHPEKLELQM